MRSLILILALSLTACTRSTEEQDYLAMRERVISNVTKFEDGPYVCFVYVGRGISCVVKPGVTGGTP